MIETFHFILILITTVSFAWLASALKQVIEVTNKRLREVEERAAAPAAKIPASAPPEEPLAEPLLAWCTDEGRAHGPFSSIAEALDDLREYGLKPGTDYYVSPIHHIDPCAYFDADDIVEIAAERASDDLSLEDGVTFSLKPGGVEALQAWAKTYVTEDDYQWTVCSTNAVHLGRVAADGSLEEGDFTEELTARKGEYRSHFRVIRVPGSYNAWQLIEQPEPGGKVTVLATSEHRSLLSPQAERLERMRRNLEGWRRRAFDVEAAASTPKERTP